MSETSKRPGARDISELKARLGLKKGGAKQPAGGGVVAPPGMKGRGVIPAPPGAAPPRPHIPDASVDPFGAMNAMASHGAATAQPHVVVINDGKPVESVEHKGRIKVIAKMALMIVIPLVFGLIVGQVSSKANVYNQVIDDAGKIKEDVEVVGKNLINVQNILLRAKERGPGGNKFITNDTELTEELANLGRIEGKLVEREGQQVWLGETLVYESMLYTLSPAAVAEVLGFYVDIAKLNEQIKSHVMASKEEAKIIKDGQVAVQGFNPYQWGALLQIPEGDDAAGKPIAFKFVQLGTPVCPGETKPNDAGCGNQMPAGHRYREDQEGPWGVKQVTEAGADGASVAADRLVYIEPNKLLKQLLAGGDSAMADSAYMRRIEKLEERINALVDQRKLILEGLNKKANESKKFTFFM